MIAYLLLTISSALAGYGLYKDWKNNRNYWVHIPVFVLILGGWVFGMINTSSTIKQNQADKAVLNGQIQGLNRTISEGQNQAVGTISHLTDRVSELQSKVDNADLRKQADELKQELINTQKAMAPPPKATLLFDVGGVPPLIGGKPVLSTTRAMNGDRFTLPFDVIVTPEADANDGYLVLEICEGCRFATEPKGWVKVEGSLETRRNLNFPFFLANSASQTFTVDIIPPVGATTVSIGLDYRCKTCKSIGAQVATVNLSRAQ